MYPPVCFYHMLQRHQHVPKAKMNINFGREHPKILMVRFLIHCTHVLHQRAEFSVFGPVVTECNACALPPTGLVYYCTLSCSQQARVCMDTKLGAAQTVCMECADDEICIKHTMHRQCTQKYTSPLNDHK